MSEEDRNSLTPGTPAQDEMYDDSPGEIQDTQQDEHESDGSDEQDTGTEDVVATLKAEVEELKKRVAHGTRTFQDLQKAQAMLAQYQQRDAYWRSNNVIPEEIDRIIQASYGDDVPQPKTPKSGKQTQEVPYVTPQQMEGYLWARDLLRDWNAEKRSFFKENPELASPEFGTHLDTIAKHLADEELAAYGVLKSGADEIMAKASKRLKAAISQAENKVAKMAQTKRSKVKEQGVVETRTRGGAPQKGDDDETMTEEQYLNYSRKMFADMHRTHQQKIRGRGA